MTPLRTNPPGATRVQTRPSPEDERAGSGIPILLFLFLFPFLVLAGCRGEGPSEPDPLRQAGRSSGPAEAVTDLAVAGATESAVTVTWSQVADASGKEAWYELRYAPGPMAWNDGVPMTSGPCGSPVKGQQHGASISCSVEGLAAGTSYDFQVASFTRGDDADAASATLSNVASGSTDSAADDTTDDSSGDTGDDSSGTDSTSPACSTTDPAWIWCDDFEEDRLARYFEYDSHGGDFERVAGVGRNGSVGMRARWNSAGQVNAGNLKLAFGRTPQAYFDPVDGGTTDYREVYWRFFLKHEADWTGGGGDKLTRSTAFASSESWAQAMIAHVWSGSDPDQDYLVIDPTSGTDEEGNLQTTGYNDFANLRWLGAARGSTPLFDAEHVGGWYCVEIRVRLNAAGASDGEFQLWIDGSLDAERTGLNWVGDWADYGVNAIFLENYWNSGAPKGQERYLDDFVVSTERIGCTT